MKQGILQTHSSLISLFNQLIDLLVIPFLLWASLLLLKTDLPELSLISGGLIASVAFQFMGSVRGLYSSQRGKSIRTEILKCLKYWFIAFLVSALAISHFSNGIEINNIIYIWFTLVSAYFILFRIIVRSTLKGVRKRGYNQRNVVVLGAGPLGVNLVNNIINSPELGLNVSGFYDDNLKGFVQCDDPEVEVIGNLVDVVNDAKLLNIDQVYITLSMNHIDVIKQIVSKLADTTCSVIFVPDMFSFDLLNSRVGHLNGLPTISIYDTPMDGTNLLVKRVEDLLLASVILILISPLLVIIAAAIKLTSPGPILFKQNRYGIDGNKIKVLKFRSMNVMEDNSAVVQVTKGDARLTPVGALLRKTSLDELPQFINVIQGNMSIVGPRPHAIIHNEEYRKIIDGYMLRHKVKPGITGWAQINGWRGEVDSINKMEKRVEFDLAYINNWSLIQDLKIISLTIFKGFVNKNAY